MSADSSLMTLAQMDDAEGCNSASKRAKLTTALVADLTAALNLAQNRIVSLTAGNVSTTRMNALVEMQAQIVTTARFLRELASLSK